MPDTDIEKIRKILRHRGRVDLAELLRHSISELIMSSTYGSVWNSILSRFEIYSPIEEHDKLVSLKENDRKAISDAVVGIYPLKEDSPEISYVEFYVDVDLERERNTAVCKELGQVDFQYIREQIEKCEEKLRKRDYDGAITNARTLVESVCLFILAESGSNYEFKGNLTQLHKEVYGVLKMSPGLYEEDCFKRILSGMISIVNGLSNLRNIMSDAHGRAKTKHYEPAERHALLAVNVAKSASEFLYASWKSKNT